MRSRPLPRPDRRGLIEGILSTASARSWYSLPRPDRRGLIEGVSISSCAAVRKRSLPRPDRRGLIEGRRPGTAQVPPARLFPGQTAGASLKAPASETARASACPSLPRPDRRGLIEGACLCRIRLLRHYTLPRPDRRGLIEGIPTVYVPAATSSLPRPDRRGLIEGCFRRLERNRGSASSPARPPGPH